ncbi:hypothetical protein ILYODFUR_032440 [Ilyodon furcidens]|uniref:Uncharacterized protein n=1 Tax=Ilyodon furcidens TaxID=33524 RepID=A0ABV0UCY4_9TELE
MGMITVVSLWCEHSVAGPSLQQAYAFFDAWAVRRCRGNRIWWGNANQSNTAIDEKTLFATMTGLSRHMTQFATEEVVRHLHTSNSNFSRYFPRQGLCLPYNAEVTSELLLVTLCIYNIKCFPAGCKTHYETVCRNFQYSQPDQAEKATAIKKSAQCRSRRKRLLEAWQSVLEAEELAFWKGVTIDLMPDEEDGSFEGVSGWIVGPPRFRSQELSDLCLKLQKRLEADPKYSVTHHRHLHNGEFSARTPPLHGPELDKFFTSSLPNPVLFIDLFFL